MSDAMPVLNGWALAAASPFWRASWQGGAALALIWCACRLLPGLSPGARCWLWRLAYLKLFVALAWAAPVDLPLLPSDFGFRAGARSAGPVPGSGRLDFGLGRQRHPAAFTGMDRMGTVKQPLPSAPSGTGSEWGKAPSPSLYPIHPVHPCDNRALDLAGNPNPKSPPPLPIAPPPAGWLVLWMAGAALFGGKLVREGRASRRLARAAAPLADQRVIEAYAVLGPGFGLRCLPRLLLSEDDGGPVLVGSIPPVLILPPSLLRSCSEGELTALLAHELAHLKRRDLLWAWLPALAQALFFVHPLVWLSQREWRLAQEIACDELAVRITGTPPLAYGQAVLKVAARRRPPCVEPAALGAAGSYQSLRWRFLALQQIRPVSLRSWRAISALLAAFGVALLVPWRVTAQAAPSNPSPPSGAPEPHHPEHGSADRRRQEQRLAAERARLLLLKQELSAVSERNRQLQTEIARQQAMLAELRAQQAAHQAQLAELAAQKQALLRRAALRNQQLVAERSRLNQVIALQRALLLQQAALRERLRRERLQHPPPPTRHRSGSEPPPSSP